MLLKMIGTWVNQVLKLPITFFNDNTICFVLMAEVTSNHTDSMVASPKINYASIADWRSSKA